MGRYDYDPYTVSFDPWTVNHWWVYVRDGAGELVSTAGPFDNTAEAEDVQEEEQAEWGAGFDVRVVADPSNADPETMADFQEEHGWK